MEDQMEEPGMVPDTEPANLPIDDHATLSDYKSNPVDIKRSFQSNSASPTKRLLDPAPIPPVDLPKIENKDEQPVFMSENQNIWGS